MLKINIFTYVFWPEQFLVNELVQEISKKNEVHVLTGLPNYPEGNFFKNYSVASGPYLQNFSEAKIRRYPVIPRKKGYFFLILNYLSHLVGGFFTQYYLPKADWAFVFATSPITTAIPAIVWANLNGAKVCIWLQDLWPDSVAAVGATSRKSIFYKVLGHLVSWIYKRADLILIQSPTFESNLKEFGYKGPYHVVPNWAPDLDFDNAKIPDWITTGQDKFKVTFAGNVGKAQAIDTVIDAAKILSSKENIHFYIVGDGSELERIEKLAIENKLMNVSFFGRKPLQDMPGLFKASDALLVSLKKDPIFEKTIPSKIQAYMAAGKPLIASLDGVGAEVIRHSKCGFVAAAEDAQDLADGIYALSVMPTQTREQLGINAKSYFYANYRKDTIIGQIISYLERYK